MGTTRLRFDQILMQRYRLARQDVIKTVQLDHLTEQGG
jgi:hypothetical protein